jgi:hypothetical protein
MSDNPHTTNYLIKAIVGIGIGVAIPIGILLWGRL